MGPKKRNKGEKTTSTNERGNNVSETPHLCNFRQHLCVCVPSGAQLQTHPLHALPQPACRVVLLSTIKYPIDLSLISFSFSYFISRGSDEQYRSPTKCQHNHRQRKKTKEKKGVPAQENDDGRRVEWPKPTTIEKKPGKIREGRKQKMLAIFLGFIFFFAEVARRVDMFLMI